MQQTVHVCNTEQGLGIIVIIDELTLCNANWFPKTS